MANSKVLTGSDIVKDLEKSGNKLIVNYCKRTKIPLDTVIKAKYTVTNPTESGIPYNDINYILTLINQGIVEKDGVRDFDYTDYVLLCDYDIKDFMHICSLVQEYREKQSKKVYTFFDKAKKRNKRHMNFEQELESNLIFNIKGELTEVSDEAKIVVYQFMKDNNIDCELGIYYPLLRRYMSGDLNLFKQNNKHKKDK